MNAASADAHSVDVESMRTAIAELLGPEPATLGPDVLDLRLTSLRGDIQLLMPEVERAALAQPPNDIPRYCALACVGEARMKLSLHARGATPGMPYARRLARVLRALLDHYESLSDQAMCLRCDQPIRDGQESEPYGKDSPSGPPVQAGRIHSVCTPATSR